MISARETQPRYENLAAITALRGIAALLVCLHHYSKMFLPETGLVASQYTDFILNGYIWVDFFFILSGFVLTHVYHKTFFVSINGPHYREFMLARFARIYPLHIFTLFLLLGFEFIEAIQYVLQNGVAHTLSVWPYGESQLFFTGSSDPRSFVKNIFMVHSLTLSPIETSWNHPAWSIGTEWIAYFLIPVWIFLLYKKLMSSQGIPILLVATLLSCFAIISWIGTLTIYDLDVAGFLGLLRCICEGIIGICLYVIYIRWKPTAFFIGNTVIGVLFLTMILMMHWNITDVAIILVITLIIVLINSHRGLYHKILTTSGLVYLGVISYSVYLMHIPLVKMVNTISLAVTGTVPQNSLNFFESMLAMPLALLVVIIISHFSYRYLEVPMRNLIRQSSRIKRWLKI